MTPDEHVKKAAEWVGEQCAEAFADEVLAEELPTESPLEEIFYVWWEACRRGRGFGRSDPFALETTVVHQVKVGRYRLDYAIAFNDPKTMAEAVEFGVAPPKIAVELDGHDFHEKTKEQVTARNRRDRDLQTAGWHVFHFSGSEFNRDPKGCVTQVMEYAQWEYYRLWTRVYNAKERRANETAATPGQA